MQIQFFKSQIKTQNCTRYGDADFRTNDVASPFGVLARNNIIQAICAQWNPVERFENKIIITFPFIVGRQPFHLASVIRCGITNPAFDIMLISQPNNERRILHFNWTQTNAKTLRM